MSTTANNIYCAFEIDGETKFYLCPRNENCCQTGCCVNLAIHFYQLWYYWLLVIILFMFCSGGRWWFRFCRSSNRTRSHAPANPLPHPSTGITSSNLRPASYRPQCYHPHCHHMIGGAAGHASNMHHPRRVRVLHRSTEQRNSMYYFQRIWKSPHAMQHQQFPPSYSTMSFNIRGTDAPPGDAGVVAESTMNRQNSENIGDRPASLRPNNFTCPYYQLYGPPPSYDLVVQLASNEGATTSCILAESASRPIRDIENAQVNNAEVSGGIAVEDILISATDQQLNERGGVDCEAVARGLVVEAEIPLISVKCDAAGTTQLENFNTTTFAATCSGAVAGDEEKALTVNGGSCAEKSKRIVGVTSTAGNLEEKPSTSSSSALQ